MTPIYNRYEIERVPTSASGGPVVGRDTVLECDVVLYWWTPDAAVAEIEFSEEGVSTFADLNRNYLVARTEEAAQPAVVRLRAAGAFADAPAPVTVPKDVAAIPRPGKPRVEPPPPAKELPKALSERGEPRVKPVPAPPPPIDGGRSPWGRIVFITMLAAGAIGWVLWSPAPSVTLHVDHTVVTEGEPLQLTWEAMHAESVSIEPGLPLQPVKGSTTVWPRKKTSYLITAKGRGGSVEARQEVQVDPPLYISLAPDRGTVTRGEGTTVRWEVRGAESATLLPDGTPVQRSGAKRVDPTQKTTYRLTAMRPSGRTEYREIVVDVVEKVNEPPTRRDVDKAITRTSPPSRPPSPPPLPPTILSFSAEANPVPTCSSVTVQWDVRNANHISINPGIPTAESRGSKTIRIARPKLLELRATGSGEPALKLLQVNVSSLPVVGPPQCGEFMWSGEMPAAGQLEIGFQGGKRSDPPGSIDGDGLPNMLAKIIPAEDFVEVTGQPFVLNAAKVVVLVRKSGSLSLHFWWERNR